MALDTFWAFDASSDPQRIEIRRLNRYLIWYWQLLRLELVSSTQGTQNLDSVLSVFSKRPLIEIAGPEVRSRENRTFYSLDESKFDEPELALLYGQKISRWGHAPGARIKDILNGFRERNPEKIRAALKSISDQVQD